jgi:GNAT superfamily N-acetyltransferase
VPTHETWVATVEDSVVGLMVLNGGELDQPYVDPPWRGHGIGDRLVELAKKRCPVGLALWTFQVNGPAQRFYERHGFVAVERTDSGPDWSNAKHVHSRIEDTTLRRNPITQVR